MVQRFTRSVLGIAVLLFGSVLVSALFPAPAWAAAPNLNSIDPVSQAAGGVGFTLTLNGSQFVDPMTVNFGATVLAAVVTNPANATVAIPAGLIPISAAGTTVNVSVTTADGSSGNQTFTINQPVPSISALNPGGKNLNDGTFTLTVIGTGFTAASVVKFAGTNLPTSELVPGSGQALTAVVNASFLTTGGTFAITVFNPTPGGGTSNSSDFLVLNPAPTLDSISPSSVLAGSGAVTLTVNGTNFVSGSKVQFQGSDRTTTFVSTIKLTAVLPSGDTTTAGIFGISVANSSPGGGSTTQTAFTVNNPVPTLSSISPSSIAAGSGLQTITLNGTNFLSASTAQWSGSSRTVAFVNSTTLKMEVLASDVATAGTFTVTVVNNGPGGGPGTKTIDVTNPNPSISTLAPTPALVGTGAFTLTINGSGFVGGAAASQVTWNGSNRTTTFVNSTRLLAAITAADISATGTAVVGVTNPGPGGGSASVNNYPIENPVPSISSFSPASVTAGGPAFTLTIIGTGFVSSSQAGWNGANRTTHFIDSTHISADISAADIATGAIGEVTVSNPGPGGGLAGSPYNTNNPAPTISTLSPASVLKGSGAFSLTINGSNFVSGEDVKWAGSSRTVTFINSTRIVAAILSTDVASPGTFQITVTPPAPAEGIPAIATYDVENPIPTISSFSPASVLAGSSAFTLTINGTNFDSLTTVKWNGSDRTVLSFTSTTITFAVPAADVVTAANISISVTNPGPGGGSRSDTFVVNNPVPTLTSFNPASTIAESGAFTLTINGTGFNASTTVAWAGSSRTIVSFTSVQLRVAILASDVFSAGNYPVSINNPGPGGGTILPVYPVNNPVPTLTSISPTGANATTAAFTLSVTGTNFVTTSQVLWGGSTRSTTFVNSTTLRAAITDTDIHTAGTVQVTVFNPPQGGGETAAQTFTISNLAPTITSVSPAIPIALGPTFTLTVNGTNFYDTSSVRWAGSARPTSFVNATQLLATITAADIAVAGDIVVSVFNPPPGGGTANLTITVNNPVPTITSLDPTSLTVPHPAFTLTINGTNFIGTAEARWNGSARTTIFVNNSQLRAIIPATDILTAGTAQVTVFNQGPGGGVSNAKTFTINNPVPSITGLSPSGITAGVASDFTLLVVGSEFVGTSVIRWGGAAKTTQFISPNQIAAVITAADRKTAGDLDVTVFNPTPGGGESGPVKFSLKNPEPALISFSPATASAGGSDFELTLFGANFVAASVVRWNGSDRTTVFIGANTIIGKIRTADVASGGTFPVSVFTPGPGGGTATLGFNVVNSTPTLTSLSPASASVGGGPFTLTLTGTAFVNGSAVVWNGALRTTTFVSSTQLTAAIPASDLTALGAAQVVVFNPAPGGGVSAALVFNINNGLPALTSLAPTTATAGGAAFTLTITGSNFSAQSTATLNSSGRPTTFVSATQLFMTVLNTDISAVGTAKIAVVNPPPGGGTSNSLDLTISNSVPTLTALAPSKVNAGSSAFTLTINGTNFVAGSQARFGGSSRATTFVSSTKLTTAVAASEVAVAGTIQVSVFNPAPGGGTSANLLLTVSTPQPIIEITMSKAIYVNGDSITAAQLRLSNPSNLTLPVEAKVWLSIPGAEPMSILNVGSDGSFSLPANFIQDVGPVTLFAVGPSTAGGNYEFSSRIVNPATGEMLSEDLNPFAVSGPTAETTEEESAEVPVTPPVIDIAMTKSSYTTGDAVQTSKFRLKNPDAGAASVEVKLWRVTPDSTAPTSVASLGADGSISLPTGFDSELGPISFGAVAANTALGNYEFNGRLIDPTTGKLYSESIAKYVIK